MQYPQKEGLTDTSSTSAAMASLLHHHHHNQTSLLPKTPKKETNIWYPYDNPSDTYAMPTTALTTSATTIRDRLDKSPLLSPFATPPLPTLAHEKKISSTTGVSSTSVSSSSSCRYYPTIDKHDLFSSYANIVSESTSSPLHHHQPHRAASAFPFSTFTTDGPSSTTTAGHHSQLHQSQSPLFAHTFKPTKSSSKSVSSSSSSFGPPFSPVGPYPLLQNMSYEAAAAVSSARCALPSPTIFPPTPPPSAPWAPWGGF